MPEDTGSYFTDLDHIAGTTYSNVCLIQVNVNHSNRRHTFLRGEKYAMKTFADSMAQDTIRELDVLWNTDHPNVLGALEIVKRKQSSSEIIGLSVVLPLATGSLDMLNPDYVTPDILFQASLGLSYLHKNDIIHNDIKPQNFLIFAKEPMSIGYGGIKSSNVTVKIADFGISRRANGQTITNDVSQGEFYRPPELLELGEDVSEFPHMFESDMWALGITFDQIIRGEHILREEDYENLDDITKSVTSRILESDEWKQHPRYNTPVLQGISDLISSLLCKKEDRATIDDVLNHHVFHGMERPISETISYPRPMMSDLSPAQRLARINITSWLHEIHSKLNYPDQSYFLAVDIFDRYVQLSHSAVSLLSEINEDKLKQIGLACLCIGGMLTTYTIVDDCIYLSGINWYEDLEKDITAKMSDIMNTLEYRLFCPTVDIRHPNVNTDRLKMLVNMYHLMESIERRLSE